jgi:ELWxxDGT repeat protein
MIRTSLRRISVVACALAGAKALAVQPPHIIDINTVPTIQSSNPRFVGQMNGWTLFQAQDSAGQLQFWRSDGTTSGTSVIRPDFGQVKITALPYFLQVHDLTYYRVTRGGRTSLWLTDASAERTHESRLTAITDSTTPDIVGATADFLFFDHVIPGGVDQLVALDNRAGTGQATTTLATIRGHAGGVAAGANLYFQATQGSDAELWTSDGTPAGTMRLADLQTGPGSSSPRHFFNFNDRIYFLADEAPNDVAVFALNPANNAVFRLGTVQGQPDASPEGPARFYPVGPHLLFEGHEPGTSNFELWRTDGTSIGTSKVSEIAPGNQRSVADSCRSQQQADIHRR